MEVNEMEDTKKVIDYIREANANLECGKVEEAFSLIEKRLSRRTLTHSVFTIQ